MAKIRSWMELMPYEKLTTKLSKFMYSPSLPCSCWAAIVLSHTLVPDFPLVFLVWNYAADVWLLLNTSLRWSLYCWCDHSKGILFLAPLFVVISVCWFWVYLLFHCPSHPLSYSGQFHMPVAFNSECFIPVVWPLLCHGRAGFVHAFLV